MPPRKKKRKTDSRAGEQGEDPVPVRRRLVLDRQHHDQEKAEAGGKEGLGRARK